MSQVSLDKLFIIAEAGPLLDEVENFLRARKQPALADQLMKLQQDAGVAVSKVMGEDMPQGEISARLYADYQDVTSLRVFNVLKQTSAALGSDMKTRFIAFAQKALEIEPPRPDQAADWYKNKHGL